MPPAYDTSKARYPVVYWLYGYEQTNEEREREIAAYVAAHDVIVISTGPVETTGEFPLYFPELAAHVDATLRTVAGRDHRGVSGAALGGFLALWTAGKFPDLVASASMRPVRGSRHPRSCPAASSQYRRSLSRDVANTRRWRRVPRTRRLSARRNHTGAH